MPILFDSDGRFVLYHDGSGDIYCMAQIGFDDVGTPYGITTAWTSKVKREIGITEQIEEEPVDALVERHVFNNVDSIDVAIKHLKFLKKQFKRVQKAIEAADNDVDSHAANEQAQEVVGPQKQEDTYIATSGKRDGPAPQWSDWRDTDPFE